MTEETTRLGCAACGKGWPKRGNVIDLHPETEGEPAPRAFSRLHLVASADGPPPGEWVEWGAALVRTGRAGVGELSAREAVLRRSWRRDEGVALLCPGNGRLSVLQQVVAWRARRAVVLKGYGFGQWEHLEPGEILRRARQRLRGLFTAPASLMRDVGRRRLVRRALSDRRLAERFWTRHGPPGRTPGGIVVDVGCGWGRHAALLANLGCTVIGLDIQAHPETWERMYGSWFLRGSDADLARLEPGIAEGCVCLEVLQYLEDDLAALSQIARVVKPGGWVLVSVTNRDNAWTRRTGRKLLADDPSRQYYTADGLVALLEEAGLRLQRLDGEGLVSPVLPRAAAFVLDLLLPAGWRRMLERSVPPTRRKLLWALAVKEAA